MRNKQAILAGSAIGGVFALSLAISFFAGMRVERAGKHMPYDFVARRQSGHGVVGVIDSLGKDTLLVKDRTLAIRTILVDRQTRIRHGFSPLQFSNLKIGQRVIVLGDPKEQEGAIKAKIIRIITEFEKDSTNSARPHLFR